MYQIGLSGLDMALIRDDRIKVTAKGKIADLITGTGVDINLEADIEDPELTALLLSGSMPQFNDIWFHAHLIDFENNLRLTEIQAQLSDPLGLKVALTGHIDFNPDAANLIQAMALTVDLDAPTTIAAQPFLIDVIPEMGPVTGKVILNTHEMNLSTKDIDFVVGAGQLVTLYIKGHIDVIPLDSDAPVKDIFLDLTLNADRLKSVGTLLQQDWPDIGPVMLTSRYIQRADKGN